MLAPGSFSEFSQLASISEDVDTPSAVDMIQRLVEGQKAFVRTARLLYPIANNTHDEVTADLLTQRIQSHEKTA